MINPYGSRPCNGPASLRGKKIRALMRKRTIRNENAYTWTMGYNNCVGRFSPGGNFGKFSGSSLNRNKQLKIEYYGKDLCTITDDFIQVAMQTGRKLSEKYGEVPGELLALIERGDDASQEGYRLWISEQVGGDVFGLCVPVHMLSARSRGKIKDKATAFFRACPGSRVFCTLTFIAAVDDKTGVTILNKFLVALRKKFKDLQYFWVAERQTSNPDTPNNIHFHMILNKRLPINVYNPLWVLQQYNAGLRAKDKLGNRISMEDITRRYQEGTVGKVLNPMDIKKVHSIGRLSSYLTKYITKQKKDEPFGCAVWHCSRRVSRIFTRAIVGPSAFAYLKSFANYKLDKTTGECWPALEQRGAFHVIIYVNDKKAPLRYLKEMELINKWILEGLDITKLPELDDEAYTREYIEESGMGIK